MNLIFLRCCPLIQTQSSWMRSSRTTSLLCCCTLSSSIEGEKLANTSFLLNYHQHFCDNNFAASRFFFCTWALKVWLRESFHSCWSVSVVPHPLSTVPLPPPSFRPLHTPHLTVSPSMCSLLLSPFVIISFFTLISHSLILSFSVTFFSLLSSLTLSFLPRSLL